MKTQNHTNRSVRFKNLTGEVSQNLMKNIVQGFKKPHLSVMSNRQHYSYLILALCLSAAFWSCSSKADSSATKATPADDVIVPVRLVPVSTVTRAEPVVASGLVSS